MKKTLLRVVPISLFLVFAMNACDDDFLGTRSVTGVWAVYETSTTFLEQNFDVDIDYFPGDSTKISIDNFSGLGFNTEVIANLSGLTLTIPVQTVVDDQSNSWTVSGSGVISRSYRDITMDYAYGGTSFTARLQKRF
jgi:hypothetical protein